jgi:ATP-dependent RNA helicase DDX24/MAK5
MPKRKFAKPTADNAKRRKAVHVDSLPWSTVELPEMFGDAEGFYGLEEVAGVDVVRQGGTVQFVSRSALIDRVVYLLINVSQVTAAETATDDGSEFGGFDDPPESSPKRPADGNDANAEVSHKGEGPKEKTDPLDANQEDLELETDVFTRAQGIGADLDDVEDIDMSGWARLELSPQILSSIARLKFSKPTPIQARSVPEILKGHDVIGKAATGSGKTLAYGIPIVEKWLSKFSGTEEKSVKRHPTALILSPTRELSHQITAHIKELCVGLPNAPRVCSVTGGLSIQKQQRQLENADIVIGTPGRLWEVLSSSTSFLGSFREVDFLVVDEADRLLTDGHFQEAEQIFNALDRRETDEAQDEAGEAPPLRSRQTLVFSATFHKGLQQKLAGKGRYNLLDDAQSMEYLLKKLSFREEKPKFIDVNPVSQMAEGLKEGLVECGAMEKDLYLYSVLLFQPTSRTLVFTNSISSVRRLTPFLQNLNLPAFALHSEMAQKARLRSIERFTSPKQGDSAASAILVATDVAARGLDIPGIDMVVHYHVPRAADTYVHRSGRTARAKRSGISILLCSPEEVVPTRRLIAKVHAATESKASKNKVTDRKRTDYFIQTLDIDRRIVSRLKERVVLAKKIADANLAKERDRKDSDWMKEAAETLGVDYDSDELEKAGKWGGRGSDRKKKEKEAREMTKAEIGAMRAQLKQLLSKRVNTGISEKFLHGVDVNKLLNGEKGEFFGTAPTLGLEEL